MSGEQATKSKNERARRDRRRAIGLWIKRIVLVLLATVVIAAIVVAALPKPIEVDLQEVERGPLRAIVAEDGVTRFEDRYVLSSPLTGTMSRIGLQPGDTVREGSEVATVSPAAPSLLDARSRAEAEARLAAARAALRQSEAQIAGAEAALQKAEREAARIERLVASGVSATGDLEDARFAVRTRTEEQRALQFAAKVASEQVESARAALGLLGSRGDESLSIRSPVGGTVLRVLRRDEIGLVQAAAPLLEIGAPQSMDVVIDVLTRDAIQIEPGQRVRLIRWGGDRSLEGVVSRVEPSAFTKVSSLGVEEQRVNVIVELVDPPETWRRLGDGYRVEAEIVVWEGTDVLSVPLGAIFRHGEEWAAYVARDDRAELVTIELGQRGTARVEVTSGLGEGERVVLHPGDRVRQGQSIVERR